MKPLPLALRRLALSLGLLGVLPLVSGTALAADQATMERLERVEASLSRTEASVDRVSADVTSRSGFIGGAEAKLRFEDAVYAYMVREYDVAAREFFTLVEADAFKSGSVYKTDSEWYLGESLFEMGNYALAEEAFQTIIDQGAEHPQFDDAVRRQLELYGLTGDAEAFSRLYTAYIVTGTVQPTDLVKYTVGKSLYRQDEFARAKAMLDEIQPSSYYYARSRYVIGTILVVEGSYEAAIEEFRISAESSITTAEDREVVDLSNLALGRLYYETDQFTKSAEYYQRISRESDYFADALYEIGWTFIKEGDYSQASQSVEIFLLAFPEHRYTAELKLLQGHLNMKQTAYESALQNYEGVVDEYTPVEEAIAEIERDAMRPMEWFDTLVEADSLSTVYDEKLPRYAVEMLASDPEVARALDLHKELEKQEADVAESEQLISEIQAAFDSGADGIASFQQARLELGRLELEMNQIREDLLVAEEAWLLANLPSNMQPEIRALQQAREDLVRDQGQNARKAADQQAEAKRVQAEKKKAEVVKLESEITAMERQASELGARLSQSDLTEAEKLDVSERLERVRGDLQASKVQQVHLEEQFQKLSEESVEASQMGTHLANVIVAEGFDTLHKKLAPYRRHVTDADKAEVTRRLDSVWAEVGGLSTEVSSLRERIDSLETSELAKLQRTFQEEVANVSAERMELTGKSIEASELADHAARSGFFRLRNTFAENVLKADKGIVDVYWVRKTEVSDQVEVSKKEREALVRELNGRFATIRAGLPEPAPEPTGTEGEPEGTNP